MSERDFLGRGWAFPPTFRGQGAAVGTVANEEDLQQSLAILLATRPGERLMNETFGCDLQDMLFEEIDQGLLTQIENRVSEAIIRHEPRIILERVTVAAALETEGMVTIDILYVIPETNSRYNMVYPFYLFETAAGRKEDAA
ncbi:MAG: GPW/gp25 family protein [Anaerolineales bacterium]|nr:GPW/gp25 family protein [Anaerolineales bacterium]MCB8963008.1 GPW/gp25 family protein [Ardenticatenales bacterium]MCB0005150.1 GPW/gp25 family protein [Anaerolineales bacterium]MCB0011975.1 GPW/gp25 family protein [Anaerolineales bacterium]MCB0019090.1 GPW/gp25 family protein [Anaerolineales bacterium]